MKRKIIRGGGKAALFTVCFIMIFLILQPIFVPKFGDTAGFFEIEPNSVDVLCLGASQMFCTVDAKKLTEEYGISSYDFGASSQLLPITSYYLEEALKTQKPKVVMVEVCSLYSSLEGFRAHPDVQTLAWSYAPMQYSKEKWASLDELLGGDTLATARYCIFPLLAYHSRWNDLIKKDFFPNASWQVTDSRGFVPHDTVTSVSIAYTAADDGKEREVPIESDRAMEKIADLCRENGIALVFFKAPVASWTRNDSKAVKSYMQKRGFQYLELNDYLDTIGIDPDTDFYNSAHLNTSGASKTTDFIAEYLIANFHDQLEP